MAESQSSMSSGRGGGRTWRAGEEENHRRRRLGGGSKACFSGSSAWGTMATVGSTGDESSYPSAAAAPCFLPPSPAGRRRPSLRAPAPFSPRSPVGEAGAARFFCDPRAEEEGRHFLDSCTLCNKPLRANRDIFMYRGDVPFCSEECRQEQMDMDEALERSAMKASTRKAASSSSSEQQQGIRVPAAGAIVAG